MESGRDPFVTTSSETAAALHAFSQGNAEESVGSSKPAGLLETGSGDSLTKQCTDLKKQIYERWERSILRRNNFTPTIPLQGANTKPAANGEPKIIRGREGVAKLLSAGRRSPSGAGRGAGGGNSSAVGDIVSSAKAGASLSDVQSSSTRLLRHVGTGASSRKSNEIKDARDLVAVLDRAARDSLSTFQKRMSEVDAELAEMGSRPPSSSEFRVCFDPLLPAPPFCIFCMSSWLSPCACVSPILSF